MENNLFAAFYGFKGSLDKLLTALGKNLKPYIIRDQLSLDKLSLKIVFYLAGRRKTHLDLLETELNEVIEKFHLLRYDHRIYKGLITVTQIHAAPYGRLLDLLIRPLTPGINKHRIPAVSLYIFHNVSLSKIQSRRMPA